MRSYYGWVCRCCLLSLSTICGFMVAFVVVVVNQSAQYVVLIWLGLSSLSSVNKHNLWSHYNWVYCCCRHSVITICGGNMVGFIVVFVCQ
jgi:hypothetical protein